MFIRKSILILMLIVMTVGAGATVAQDSPKEIRFGTLQGAFIDNVNTMMVDQFQKAHPDIKVNVEYLTGDLGTVLAAQAAAGTLPDVTFCAPLFFRPARHHFPRRPAVSARGKRSGARSRRATTR